MKLSIPLLLTFSFYVTVTGQAGNFYNIVIKLDGGADVVWAGDNEGTQIQIRSPSWKFGRQPDGTEANDPWPKLADRQVWLLRRDGTAITRLREPVVTSWGSWGRMRRWTLYDFPSGAREAYVVVVQYGDKLYTARIAQKQK